MSAFLTTAHTWYGGAVETGVAKESLRLLPSTVHSMAPSNSTLIYTSALRGLYAQIRLFIFVEACHRPFSRKGKAIAQVRHTTHSVRAPEKSRQSPWLSRLGYIPLYVRHRVCLFDYLLCEPSFSIVDSECACLTRAQKVDNLLLDL